MSTSTLTHLPTIPSFRPEYGVFINGAWESGHSGETIELVNPATNAPLARIAAGDAVDVRLAVDAAEVAFRSWAHTSPAQRQELLSELSRRLRARVDDFAMLETIGNGCTINESTGFLVPFAAEQFDMFAGTAWNHTGSTRTSGTRLGLVHRVPLGVCAQIIPWNAPLLMFAAKVAPALAAGNAVVVKPSEIACLSVLAFMDEIADIVPPGLINVVTGYGAAVGEPLVTDRRVRKVAFTGSRPTARTLMHYAATNIISQTMELGGKSANIVCADADLDAAAEGVAMSTVVAKGEFCMAGSRVFVHDAVYDEFLERVSATLDKVVIGDPTSPRTSLGPLASKAQLKKVTEYMDLGAQEARLLHGGGSVSVPDLPHGNFVEPTIFVDVDNSMRIAQEEIFGPVTTVLRWSDENEMIAQANDTVYGLSGGVWTGDLSTAHRLAGRLDTGSVFINQYYNMMENMPIGGTKESGVGREYGHEVLDHYSSTKSVIINMRPGKIGIFDH